MHLLYHYDASRNKRVGIKAAPFSSFQVVTDKLPRSYIFLLLQKKRWGEDDENGFGVSHHLINSHFILVPSPL